MKGERSDVPVAPPLVWPWRRLRTGALARFMAGLVLVPPTWITLLLVGFVFVVNCAALIGLDWSVEGASKAVMSGGLLWPAGSYLTKLRLPAATPRSVGAPSRAAKAPPHSRRRGWRGGHWPPE